MMTPPSRIHHVNKRNPLNDAVMSKSDSPDRIRATTPFPIHYKTACLLNQPHPCNNAATTPEMSEYSLDKTHTIMEKTHTHDEVRA